MGVPNAHLVGTSYGGWIAPFGDDVLGAAIKAQMSLPFDLLLGRKTFDIWAPYWPKHADWWPGITGVVTGINEAGLCAAILVRFGNVGARDGLPVAYAHDASHFVLTPQATLADGDMVALTWQMTGTQLGELPGLPPTGNTILGRGVSIMRLAGDRVAACTDYYDAAAMIRQLTGANS